CTSKRSSGSWCKEGRNGGRALLLPASEQVLPTGVAVLRSAGRAKAQPTRQRAYSKGARASFAERPNVRRRNWSIQEAPIGDRLSPGLPPGAFLFSSPRESQPQQYHLTCGSLVQLSNTLRHERRTLRLGPVPPDRLRPHSSARRCVASARPAARARRERPRSRRAAEQRDELALVQSIT